jgi:ubiquinone/menaquinone biosynthesis C-methylase UbiE
LDVLWQNTLKTDNICAIQGNALDLSIYPDDTFNITLVLGPMYHLFTSEDKLKCLKEAERVTKKSGIIFIAYCQFDASMIQKLSEDINAIKVKHKIPISVELKWSPDPRSLS